MAIETITSFNSKLTVLLIKYMTTQIIKITKNKTILLL